MCRMAYRVSWGVAGFGAGWYCRILELSGLMVGGPWKEGVYIIDFFLGGEGVYFCLWILTRVKYFRLVLLGWGIDSAFSGSFAVSTRCLCGIRNSY